MAVVSVEVPDKIAKKFVSYKVISSSILYDELDSEIWHDVKVGEKAEDVLEFLKTIK